MDRDTIEYLTFLIRLYRRLKAMGVYDNMAIKWNITNEAMKARGIMDELAREYRSFNADGAEHLGDVKGLRSQVGDMKIDLYAAANIMGNGSGHSDDQSKGSPEVETTKEAFQDGSGGEGAGGAEGEHHE